MRGINLTPNSDSAPDATGCGNQQLHDQRIQYDRQDRQKDEKERTKRVLDRGTREAGATGVAYRGKKTGFEEAVERVQYMIRSGRVPVAQVKAENDADARTLAGFKAAPPRPGTTAHARLQLIHDRFAVRARALELEQTMAFQPAPVVTPVRALA